MKKFIPLIALLAAAVLLPGCSPPETPTRPAANVTCNALSFYLDPALGNGYECETVPENSSSDIPSFVYIYPAHTELTIRNYPLTDTQFPPQVWIYPVERFNELLPDIVPPRVSDLKRVISGGTLGSGELPFLPAIPQIQSFSSHVTNLSFDGGQGIRFITEYSEVPFPVNNKSILYTFQGLTSDGIYWVAVTFPISSPSLPASYDTLPEGYTKETFIQNYDSYVSDVKEALEAQAPGSFSPTIDMLDSLVESITIRE